MEKWGKGVWRWGTREIVYLSLHCHHQNDSCSKLGSDERHFNVSLIMRDKVNLKTVSTNHNLFEEKREPKWNRADALIYCVLFEKPIKSYHEAKPPN